MNVELHPIAASSWGARYNIDGVICVAGAPPGTNPTGYVQLFRNGVIELVYSEVFFDPGPDYKTVMPGVGAGDVASNLLDVVARLQRLFQSLDAPPPISLFISLQGMKTVTFHVSQRLSRFGHYAFDRDTILLPEVVIADFQSSAAAVLKPAMDALWQAAGIERCLDYSEDGRWAPQP